MTRIAPYLNDREVSLLIREVLGWIFVASAATKISHPLRFHQALLSYPVPQWMRRITGTVIPIAELVVGGSLLIGFSWRWSALVACALLLIFIGALLAAMAAGRRTGCGCGGIIPTESIGIGHVLLNIALASGAAILALQTETLAAVGSMGLGSSAGEAAAASIRAVYLASLTPAALLLVVTIHGVIAAHQLRMKLDDGPIMAG